MVFSNQEKRNLTSAKKTEKRNKNRSNKITKRSRLILLGGGEGLIHFYLDFRELSINY